jgi:type IV fimbrial biogenesis protein FimT
MAFAKLRAFTILELMITITIMAILVTIGIPAFQDYALKQRLNAAVNALHSDLLLARSQAIYRDMQVTACPGNPTAGCAGSTEWSDGWIVFGDRNEDREYQDKEDLLHHGQAVEHMAIHSSSGRTTIRFYPNGSAPGSNTSISFCGLGGPGKARKLVISNLGRVRRDDFPGISAEACPPS